MSIADQIQELQNNENLAKKLDQNENLLAIRKQCSELMGAQLINKKGYNLAPLNVLGVIHPNQTTFKISI